LISLGLTRLFKSVDKLCYFLISYVKKNKQKTSENRSFIWVVPLKKFFSAEEKPKGKKIRNAEKTKNKKKKRLRSKLGRGAHDF
jgi:hypothetical protein